MQQSKYGKAYLRVTPSADLPPAECLHTFSTMDMTGYDFGTKRENP